jgi:hypothetical protein
MTVKRINLWSSPRNISTALMYAFAQRSDTMVVDEPLYAHFLTSRSDRPTHPAETEVLRSQCADGDQVIRDVLLGPCERPVAVFKQMTHHLTGLDPAFLLKMDNVLLIRDPRAIIRSYAKVIPNPGMDDVGVQQQTALLNYLKDHGALKAVLDARELLLNPPAVLEELCSLLELPFEGAMLRWETGPRPEDGVWAPWWYANVHQSTGFQPYREETFTLTPPLEALADQCRPYYEMMLEFAIKAP